MPSDKKPGDNENGGGEHNTNTQTENVVHSVKGLAEQHHTRNYENATNAQQKPTFPVRVIQVLLRRRRWRRLRKGEVSGGPHWAEIATVCLTLGIFGASCIQAYIYWKQSLLMGESINQAERSVILGTGQLNAAVNALKSSQKTFQIDQRPYMVLEENFPAFDVEGLPVPGRKISVNVQIKNIGKTPAVQVRNYIRFFPRRDRLTTNMSPKEIRDSRAAYISEIESGFSKMNAQDEVFRKKAKQFANLSPGRDFAPTKGVLITSPEDFVMEANDGPLLQTGELALYVIGESLYSDSYGNPYRTEYCYFYFGPYPKIWHLCDSHNKNY